MPSSIFAYDQLRDTDQFVAAAGRIWRMDGTEQVVYARRPNGGSDIHVVFVANPPTGQASHIFQGVLSDRLQYSADFLDIAAGDLDRLPDSAGNHHDEVVIAYAGPGQNNQLSVNVAVLDYTAPASAPPAPVAVTSATASNTINAGNFANSIDDKAILPVDNVLGVVVGDFDGDGKKEIVVAHLGDNQTMYVTTFRYTNDGQGNRSLVQVAVSTDTALTNPSSSFVGTLDLAVGEFDGNRGDELLLGRVDWHKYYDFPDGDRVAQRVVFTAWKADANLTMKLSGQTQVLSDQVKGRGDTDPLSFDDLGGRVRVQVSPGLFHYDPNNGFDFTRHQFVAAWNLGAAGDARGSLAVKSFQIATGPFNTLLIGELNELYFGAAPGDGDIYQRFSLAAGAYKGNTISPPPLWGVALNYWGDGGDAVLATLNSDLTFANSVTTGSPGNPGIGFQRLPVVPVDLDGNSVLLGSPIHLTLENVVNTDFVLQEPPKHAYYDNNPSSPSYGQIVNVSRQNKFNVSLLTQNKQTFSATTKDTSTWNIGGSTAVSAGATLSEGIPDIAEASYSIDVTAKVGYDYNQNKESYNTNYSQTTLTQTEATDNDDKVLGKLQTFDVWRYRVYGVSVTDPQGNPTNAFYEVVLPGPVLKFDAGGRDKDWYQPTYENGNILSYPQATNQTFTPSDLGSYRVPCPSASDTSCVPCKLADDPSCNAQGTKVVTQPLVPARQIAFDGTSGTLAYDWQNTISSGNSFGYSHTLAESLDVKVGVEVNVADSLKANASVDAELHNSNSWGGSQTSDTSTTSETGITLNRVSGDSNQAYDFYPTFYIARDGTVKATHAVDILGGGAREFWADIYGKKADPALNLPRRFSPVDDPNQDTDWVPSTNSLRKRMRGFFVRKDTVNPITNTYDLLTSNPVTGQSLLLEARVYNYSTAVPIKNLDVSFYAIGYDPNSDREIPIQGGAGGRCLITHTTITEMNPLEMKSASIVWNTTGWGPTGAGQSINYRIYVVLDRFNTIDETYETEDSNTNYKCVDVKGNPCSLPTGVDPGQNNEGYGYITIQGPSQQLEASLGADPSIGADASMDRRSLGANATLHKRSLGAADQSGSRLRFNHALAQLNRPMMLRATVHSDRTHNRHSHLLVYDGDPDKGGRTIAAKLIQSGNTRGAHVWFDWIPTRLGKHTLYARVVEKSDDAKTGNNTDTLDVNVVPADTTAPQLAVTLTPNSLQPADGRMVPITATISVKDDYDRRPDIRLEAITHNEANDASADVAGAEFGTDDRQFSLRAAHSGRRRDARVYEVVYSATDWAGNKTFTKVYVLVPGKRGG